VETFDFGFQRRKLFFDGLDEKQLFAGVFDFSLPAVNGLHRPQNYRGAGGKALANDFAGDAASFDEVSAGDEHNASCFGRGHFLLLMSWGAAD